MFASPAPVDLTPPGAVSVLALSTQVLVVAASDGLWRSGDAGRTWRRVVTFPAAAAIEQLGRAGDGVVASVSVVSSGPIGRTNAVLYLSHDGTAWRTVTPVVAGFGDDHSLSGLFLAFDGVTPDSSGLAFAFNVDRISYFGPMLHSGDGGRHWAPVKGLDLRTSGAQAVAFVPGTRTAFAAVSPPPYAVCSSTLMRSDDAGATWRVALRGCQADGISALSFPDARHGFAGGNTLLVTDDGGRTWTVRAARPAPSAAAGYPPYARLGLSGSRYGSVLAGACNAGGDQPCSGEVWSTGDGGRSWQDAKLGAEQVSSSGRTIVTAGGYLTPPGLSVSTDGGLRWTRIVAPTDVAVEQLTGTPHDLLAITNGRPLRSTDRGLTWQPAGGLLVPAESSQVIAESGDLALRANDQRLERSTDGGISWSPSLQPTLTKDVEPESVAFDSSDPRRAVALAADYDAAITDVLTSNDSGRTWALASTVVGIAGGQVGYAGHTIVFATSRVEVSHDEGRHWTAHLAGADFLGRSRSSSSGVAGRAIWVCGRVEGRIGHPGVVVVAISQDGGQTWREQTLAGLPAGPYGIAVPVVLPLSGTEALLATQDSSLWRTTDAGESWHQERPVLPVG